MRKIIILLSVLLFTGAVTAWGQGFGGPSPQERREKLQDLAVWKMLEVLDLSQERTDRFLPALREMQKQEAQLQEQRMRLLQELERRMTQGGSEKEVREVIQQLRMLGKQGEAVRERFFNQAESILSVQQLGRLVLFQDRFEKRMREMMKQMQEEKWHEFQKNR
jgi:hypothetical protein